MSCWPCRLSLLKHKCSQRQYLILFKASSSATLPISTTTMLLLTNLLYHTTLLVVIPILGSLPVAAKTIHWNLNYDITNILFILRSLSFSYPSNFNTISSFSFSNLAYKSILNCSFSINLRFKSCISSKRRLFSSINAS